MCLQTPKTPTKRGGIMNYLDRRIRVGSAYCDANKVDKYLNRELPRDFAVYIEEYLQGIGLKNDEPGFFCEVQPEKNLVEHMGENVFQPKRDNKWSRLVRPENFQSDPDYAKYVAGNRYVRRPGNTIYVHQPCKDMNIIDTLPYKAKQSIETTKQGMILASEMCGKSYVIHFIQLDDWHNTQRELQIERAWEVFRELSAFYMEKNFSFPLCIENLEYPKYPSTVQETLECYEKCLSICSKTKLVIDLSHFWRSRYLIRENEQRCKGKIPDFEQQKLPFHEYLSYFFETIPQEYIEYYHVAGCKDSSTHGIPGLADHEDPFKTWIVLNGSNDYYEQRNEMNIRSVIDHFIEHVLKKDRILKIILEIQNRDAFKTLRGLQIFRSQIFERYSSGQ